MGANPIGIINMPLKIGNVSYKVSVSYRMFRWTKEAMICYLNGCNCSNCYLIPQLETLNNETCRMKQYIIALIAKKGIPPELKDYTKKVIEDEN